jgi:hypothetical protein
LERTISGPQPNFRHESRAKELNIGPAQTSTPKATVLKQNERFRGRYFDRARECRPKRQKFSTIGNTSTGKFTEHRRVHDHAGGLKESDEVCIGTAQMIDPN